ncbi:MAG: hypothetical protein ACRD22_00595 [Terriglobia bacterium]
MAEFIQLPPVGWSRITNVGYQPYTVPLKIFALDDDSCLFFVSGNGNQYGFDAYVIDGASLATTHYQAVRNSAQPNISKIISFGGGFFNVLTDDGSSYSFQAANQKLNNASPIMIPANANPIPINQCASNYSKVFYDAVNRVTAFGYYNPDNGSIFAATYKAVPGGFERIASGFPGFWAIDPPELYPVPDQWDHSESAAGDTNQVISNGLSIGYNNNPLTIYRQRFLIIPGTDQAACFFTQQAFASLVALQTAGYTLKYIEPGPPPVFVGEVASPNGAGVYTALSTIFEAGGYQPDVYPSDTNIPNLAPFVMGGAMYGLHVFGDGGLWIYLPFADGSAATCAVTKKHIFVMIFYQGTTIGVIDQPPGGFFYNGTGAAHRGIGVVNNTRPISTTGRFKA